MAQNVTEKERGMIRRPRLERSKPSVRCEVGSWRQYLDFPSISPSCHVGQEDPALVGADGVPAV